MPLTRLVDGALEATVALSFGRPGSLVRSRMAHWQEPDKGTGKVALVTGATGGIGLSIATQLAAADWDVWLLGRSETKLASACSQITARQPNAKVHALSADLTNLAAVRSAAKYLLGETERIDALIHNAGAMSHGYLRTVDGNEQTAQLHLVAPFALTHELLPVLRATAGSRVITVSSGGMYTQRLIVTDLDPKPADYDGVKAYARTKRAQVVLNEVWATCPQAKGITFHAMHPGWVATPGLSESLPRFEKWLGPLLRSPDQGADTAVWLATAPEPLESNGQFWHDRRIRATVRLPGTATPASEATKLWGWTEERALQSGAKSA